MRRMTLHRAAALLSCAIAAGIAGCFQERSIRYSVATDSSLVDVGFKKLCARPWLRAAHSQLSPLLPKSRRPALLTEDLVDAMGKPIDVNANFDFDPRKRHTVIENLSGLENTAQASGSGSAIEQPAPAWPGFDDVWIPIDDRLQLSARVGFAHDANGSKKPADAIAILPGIFGDNSVRRTRDLAMTLRDNGYHVLALEIRGCGQTLKRYANIPTTLGCYEVGDILRVGEWLESQPHVRRTGLIGFCWSSNLALLAAWEDGRSGSAQWPADTFGKPLRRPPGRPHFDAGILAFSPTLPYEDILDACAAREWSVLANPVLNKLQKETRTRMQLHNYSAPDGNLRRFIDLEAARLPPPVPRDVSAGLAYLRLAPYQDCDPGPKLERARVPVAIVHGFNDPLSDGQPVADFIARIRNPNVAAIILPGGGHVGFGPYAPDYFLRLILSFFDAARGPRAAAGVQNSLIRP